MTALVSAVFVASLLGSMHCAGMCGAFLALAIDDGGRTLSRTRMQAAYHIGRLITYTALGGISGALGAALNLGAATIGVERFAAVAAGAIMILFGVVSMLRARDVAIPRFPVPAALHRLVQRGHAVAFTLPPASRALAIGLLTTLLPCGWLYAFAITAAGTASPLLGAITMAVFWAGTLPVLISLGVGLQHLTGSLRRHMPVMTSALLVVVGLYTVFGRMHVVIASPVALHGESSPTADADCSVTRVNSLNSEEMPCCRHEP